MRVPRDILIIGPFRSRLVRRTAGY